MLGGEVTVGWQAGRARLPVLQTGLAEVSGACGLPVFTASPRGPSAPGCPSVSLIPAPIFATSEQDGVPRVWAQVWGQRQRSLPGPGGGTRAHPGRRLLPREVCCDPVQAVDLQGPLGGVLGSRAAAAAVRGDV